MTFDAVIATQAGKKPIEIMCELTGDRNLEHKVKEKMYAILDADGEHAAMLAGKQAPAVKKK